MNIELIEIPESWEWTSLDSILFELEIGSRPKGGVQSIRDGIPSLGGEHLDSFGGFKFEKIKFVPNEFAEKQKRGWIQLNDILIVKDGATTGKTSFIRKSFPFKKALINEHVFRCKVADGIIPKYIFRFLSSEVGTKEILKDFRGAAQGGISRNFIKLVTIPLAPSGEQKRISIKIESLQSRSVKARKALEAIPPLLEKLRQSVLSSTFRGDLTADWRAQNPDIEPAEKLLERIRKERRKRWEENELVKMKAKGKTPKDDKWKKKYKEPEPVDTTNLPELPEGWCWATIDTIAFVTKLAGFEYTKYVTYDPNGDLPVIKAENAGKYGFKETDFSFVQSESVTHLTRSFLKGGEVLMTFVGAGVGQVAMVPDGQQYFLGPNIAMIRNESSFILSRHIELFLRSPLGFSLAMSFVKAVAQPSLSMKTIRKIPIAIPPIKEQKIIDSNLFQYSDTIEEIESIIIAMKEKHLTLDQSILSKAFRGELVPQDLNDEPASQLLERIKLEKASLEAGKKQKGKVGKGKTVIRKKEASGG